LLAGMRWLNVPRVNLLARLLALAIRGVFVLLQAKTKATTALQHKEINKSCLKVCRCIVSLQIYELH